MALGNLFQKKLSKEHFLTDTGLDDTALAMLNTYRSTILALSKASRDLKSREVQTAIYNKLTEQERIVQKAGYTFIVISEQPYAWLLPSEKYREYMRIINT